MRAFFVVINTSLTSSQIARKRQKLAGILRGHHVELVNLKMGKDYRSALNRLVKEARGIPVVILDEENSLPNKAPWLAELTKEVINEASYLQPLVIYLTRQTSANGITQTLRHAIVRDYLKRDDRGQWVEKVAESVLDLMMKPSAAEKEDILPPPSTAFDIVGTSPCYCDAIKKLENLMQSPYGFVTGESGVGKMLLIRALWQPPSEKSNFIVLPCGSFFKDYYIEGVHQITTGGREAVDQLSPYLTEADNGLLVLYHVEKLPTAVQEEFAVRLSAWSHDRGKPLRLSGVDSEGLLECDVRIIATSNYSLDALSRTGRLIPDLVSKFHRHQVYIPSLAERGEEDIQLLCQDIIKRVALQQKLPVVPAIDPVVMRILCRTPWPNNISDLVWVMEHILHQCRGQTIRQEHLPKDLGVLPSSSKQATLDIIVAQAQRSAIENTLNQTGGNVAQAAKLLGRNKGSLHRLIRKLGMKISMI